MHLYPIGSVQGNGDVVDGDAKSGLAPTKGVLSVPVVLP